MQNSETGNGQSVMASLGQKVLSLFRGGKKSPVETMEIKYLSGNELLAGADGWYIVKGIEAYAGPYKRERDAKGQLTRLRKGYTPAARKV